MPQRALLRSVGCSCILRATAYSGDRRPSVRKLQAPAGPCALTPLSGHSVPVGMPDAPGVRDDAVALRLENLEALTDTTLTRLDVDDLLVELLGRVREILDVDTAAILMLDADSEVLVASDRSSCRPDAPLDDDHSRTRDRRRVLYRRPDRTARRVHRHRSRAPPRCDISRSARAGGR